MAACKIVDVAAQFLGTLDATLQERAERQRCRSDPVHFVQQHVWIYDPEGEWLKFRLWEKQEEAFRLLFVHRLTIWLKARQLGMTWLALAYALHTLIFRRGSTVLLFSRRDTEAIDLLARIKEMHKRLPPYLREKDSVPTNAHLWTLSNGSRCMAFPTTAGDSYSATLAIVDEADLVPSLNKLLASVKPTIDAGGHLLLLSRSNKEVPESTFKSLYRAARDGQTPYKALFLPWHARPDRTPAWYEEQKQDSIARTGCLDTLYEQYPATDIEALAPNQRDKRILLEWLNPCVQELAPLDSRNPVYDLKTRKPLEMPAVPTLTVYLPPIPGEKYVVGADTAEGNPTSDDSAAVVLHARTGEHVAHLCGKVEPTTFAEQIDVVGCWYNNAMVLVERNNHGHAVLAQLRKESRLRRLRGLDGKDGWLSSGKGKTVLYDRCTDAVKNGETLIHHNRIFEQLASIEGNTLRAPEGLHDDLADAFALAISGAPAACRTLGRLESF